VQSIELLPEEEVVPAEENSAEPPLEEEWMDAD
jgi:hypothetical protein